MRRVVNKAGIVAALTAVVMATGVTRTEASELNLTGSGTSSCFTDAVNTCSTTAIAGLYSFAGALWATNRVQPAGSGYIDSFLRVGKQDQQPPDTSPLVVDGMNTSGILLNEEKEGGFGGKNFTHDIQTADGQVLWIDKNGDGLEQTAEHYYQFLLDINQEGGDPLLTLSGLQFCQSAADKLSFIDTCAGNDTLAPDTGVSTLKYDMQSRDGTPALVPGGDTVHQETENPTNTVLLDYNQGGSGIADLWVYIPASVLPDNPNANKQLYLWSQFGAPITGANTNNDGYEEWAFIHEGNLPDEPLGDSEVPEPGSLVLLGTGLLFGGHLIRRRSLKARSPKV